MTALLLRDKNINNNIKILSALDHLDEIIGRFFENNYAVENECRLRVPIGLAEKDNIFILKAVIPGLRKEDIDIEVSADKVTISGEYSNGSEEDTSYSEFVEGKFFRAIDLPGKIIPNEAIAEYKDGILEITLPKLEEEENKLVKLSL